MVTTTCSRSIRSRSGPSPFEPRRETLPDGRKIIIARGACDDKGQAMTSSKPAAPTGRWTGALPLPITMMIEGRRSAARRTYLVSFVTMPTSSSSTSH